MKLKILLNKKKIDTMVTNSTKNDSLESSFEYKFLIIFALIIYLLCIVKFCKIFFRNSCCSIIGLCKRKINSKCHRNIENDRYIHEIEINDNLFRLKYESVKPQIKLHNPNILKDIVNKNCVICSKELCLKNICNIKNLECGHTFHKKCITRWTNSNLTCPICRVPCKN